MNFSLGHGLPILIGLLLVVTSFSAMFEISEAEDGIKINENLLEYTISFENPTLSQKIINNTKFTDISLKNTFCVAKTKGEPCLPVYPVKIAIPQNTDVSDVNIIMNEKELDSSSIGADLEKYPISPYQSAVPIGVDTSSSPFYINNEIYSSSEKFPVEYYESFGVDYCRGIGILTLNLYPIHYIPKTSELFYCSNIKVKISLEENYASNKFYRDMPEDKKWVSTLVINPDIVETYSLGENVLGDGDYSGGLCNPSDNNGNGYDYVILTRNSLVDFNQAYNWSDLINYKLMDGLYTTIVTVEQIQNCPDYWNVSSLFNDTAARIREFCRDAYQDWNLQYLLVAGDQEGSASITRRLMSSNAESNVESDLYWSNLDKTFNADQDSQWGEEGDSGFDLYSELYLGSLPCDQGIDISNWMKKSFTYLNECEKDTLENAAFYGGDTTWDCQGDDFMDFTLYGTNNYLGPVPNHDGPWPSFLGFLYGFDTWNTSNPGNEFNTSVRWTAEPPNQGWLGGSESVAINGLKNAINNDQVTLLNAVAHANSQMSCDVYASSWESNYHNTKPFFIHDYGCHCGDMSASDDGVLHSMLFHDDTELAFACVYNTGYGWGNLDCTNSSSAHQQKLFWDFLLNTSKSGGTFNWQLGKAQAYSKDAMAPMINWDYYDGSFRAIIQCCLLFGDPAQRLKPPLLPDHDLIITNLNVDTYIPHGETVYVKATLINAGQNNETNVDVNFTVDGFVEDSIVLNRINSTDSTVVSFPWNPDNGTYLVGIEIPPLDGENFTANNQINKTVHVIPVPDIWINPLNYSMIQNAGELSTNYLTIGNEETSEADLTFNISYLGNWQPWLSVSPNSGIIAVGSYQNLTVSINTTGMIEGNYVAYIIIETNDLDEPTLTVPINLSVAYANDVGVISINSPIGSVLSQPYFVNATVQNFGTSNQTNVIVNCTIIDGILGTFLYEDFNCTFPPDGWSQEEAGEWDIHYGSNAGGESPEAYLYWNDINGDYSYLDTKPVNTIGAPVLSLRFTQTIDHFVSTFNCRIYSRADSTDDWMEITPWVNPITESIWNEQITVDISDDIGVGTQVRFEFDGYSYNLDYWYIDDVRIFAQISRGPGDIIYTSESLVNILANSQTTVEFSPSWYPSTGAYAINITTKLTTDEDTTNDNFMDSVIVYDFIRNVTEFPDPQGIGGYVNISCSIFDPTIIDSICVNITGPTGYLPINVSMYQYGLDDFYYNNYYSIEGNYTYFIWSKDNLGNFYQSEYHNFSILNSSYNNVDFHFKTDWNLITVPCDNNWKASTLAENITGSLLVSWFDAENQTYKSHIVGVPGYDFDIKDGYGIFVLVDQSSVFYMAGPEIFTASVPLLEGWNMIGWFHNYNTTSSSLAENITGSQLISWYDAENETFKSHIVGVPGYDFTITPGMGLFVYTDVASTWYGEG